MLLRPSDLRSLAARAPTLLLGFSITFTLYYLLTLNGWSLLGSRSFDYTTASVGSAGFSQELVTFWKDLAGSLEAARPKCDHVKVMEGEMDASDKNWEPLVEKKRPLHLELSEEDEQELARAHRQMRIEARRLAAAYPVGEGTGIVTTGGLKLFPVLLVSLRMLRRTGSTLPVEVFLGDQDEYKEVADTCENVLPALNARCRVIGDIYSQAEKVAPPVHFQFKMLAILFSSFKHVLFLDADAMPAHDPVELFKVPPYTTHGLVTWPGFYANAASPHFYHIASTTEPPVNRGTESGQLLLNKEFHREGMMMMVYYNYYGPGYYYPLQAQGGPGQGDKETFSAGVVAVNAPFYAVKTPVLAIGVHVNEKYVFAGAAQADPIQDFLYDPPTATHLHPKYEWTDDDKIGHEDPTKRKARAFFVHNVSQGTKLNPSQLLVEGGLAYAADGNSHRIWGEEKWITEKFGFDVEKRMWECVQEEACRFNETLCGTVQTFRQKVFGTTVIAGA